MIRKYPSLFLLIFVVAGIVVADNFRLPAALFLCLSGGLCLAGLLLLRSGGIKPGLLLAVGLGFFSAAQFSLAVYDFRPGHISQIARQKSRVTLFGEVIDWPVFRDDRTELIVRVDSLATDSCRPTDGAVLVKLGILTTALQRGDRITFSGYLRPVTDSHLPGGFDYRRYLSLRGVFGTVSLSQVNTVCVDRSDRGWLFSAVDDLRHHITGVFRRDLSPEAAALASGFLIGETHDIPVDLYRAFRDSGTLHLLAVSGSNVALVLVFCAFLLRPLGFSRWVRTAILLVVVFIFTLLSYGEPSVVRASIMAALVLGAGLTGRRYDLNNLVSLTALIILLGAPTQLFNVGFQLSFATAWGLVFIVPRLFGAVPFRRKSRWWRWLFFALTVSVVAQICSTPLIVYYFHRIPIIGPVANLIIVPLVSIAVVGSLVLIVTHLILPVLGALVGSVLNLLLTATVAITTSAGSGNFSVIDTAPVPVAVVLVAYAGLILATLALRFRLCRRMIVFLTLMVYLTVAIQQILPAASGSKSARLHVWSLPGGTVAVIQQADRTGCDVVITGLASCRYRMDEKLLSPGLAALGVGHIDNLIVLKADYGALNDILRFTKACGAAAVYGRSDLYPSLVDANRHDSIFSDCEILVCLNRSRIGCDSTVAGYRLCNSGLVADLSFGRLVFYDLAGPGALDAAGGEGPAVLLLTGGEAVSKRGLVRFRKAGYAAVICSEVEQDIRPGVPPPSAIADTASSAAVFVPGRGGSICLEIDEDGRVREIGALPTICH